MVDPIYVLKALFERLDSLQSRCSFGVLWIGAGLQSQLSVMNASDVLPLECLAAVQAPFHSRQAFVVANNAGERCGFMRGEPCRP